MMTRFLVVLILFVVTLLWAACAWVVAIEDPLALKRFKVWWWLVVYTTPAIVLGGDLCGLWRSFP